MKTILTLAALMITTTVALAKGPEPGLFLSGLGKVGLAISTNHDGSLHCSVNRIEKCENGKCDAADIPAGKANGKVVIDGNDAISIDGGFPSFLSSTFSGVYREFTADIGKDKMSGSINYLTGSIEVEIRSVYGFTVLNHLNEAVGKTVSFTFTGTCQNTGS
jgi:hypothetical protein